MSNPSTLRAPSPLAARLAPVLARVAGLWIASDLGYYIVLPALGLEPGYDAAPVEMTVYYLVWVAAALFTFRHLYRGWRPVERDWVSFTLLGLAVAGLVGFAVYGVPLLPPISWAGSTAPPELALATGWYFLPKSVEILFQQLLIAAMVLAFAAQGCRLRSMVLCAALLFGGMHLLLAFSEVPTVYVVRFTLAATAFGFIFPYLILRVRNGFAYSYFAHWGYYAVTLVMVHTLSQHAA